MTNDTLELRKIPMRRIKLAFESAFLAAYNTAIPTILPPSPHQIQVMADDIAILDDCYEVLRLSLFADHDVDALHKLATVAESTLTRPRMTASSPSFPPAPGPLAAHCDNALMQPTDDNSQTPTVTQPTATEAL